MKFQTPPPQGRDLSIATKFQIAPQELRFCGGEKIPDILRDHLYQPFASLDARPCDVRRDDDVAAIFHAQ